ncbi:MAG: hypothetical protein DRJ31_00180 [Candidatus Methanomethylicota archaeon]|uniref:DUF357 domain-containing protein n=1 Tax=Thermoproteota archaeon TaxID=2056631 RepID=A0A497ETQ3_9CREN|nr:MAG: hypothetical protein DRJ31_00180 [Candidatus Verstraetearchaeota archaeon]RLE52346.1 MAG: hypothetical protein DRJ33_04040 [Candidatus Verstraetearchaeota archaeon]
MLTLQKSWLRTLSVAAENLVKKYIEGVEDVLKELKLKISPGEASVKYSAVVQVLDLAKRYYEDSVHYLESKRDYLTSLTCIVYSEGLLDALRFLGLVDFRWRFEK